MDDTQENGTRFGILLLDVRLHRFRQRFVARLVALNDFSALLGDNNYMIVFIYDIHSDCKDTNK